MLGKKTAYITAMGQKAPFKSQHPTYKLGHYFSNHNKNELPCHWTSIEYLFQTYDQLIIVGN
ncbi:hypothetical protein, partial [Pseudomonas sp. 2822-17]|uniref:hypothetical protein n=1 Tax=Pseudomonas sp. 2822-17 TaxID=1712678 RepID=UPI001C461461